MLVSTDPAPTGLITALLARSRVGAAAITDRIGPSPRQMRELTEGRGLFSPYKLSRVSELTGVPEERIRAALEGLPALIRALKLRTGRRAVHARLGPVRILELNGEVTIETGDGRRIEGVHPASFAGPELLDQFGLIPVREEEEQPPFEPAIKPDTNPRSVEEEIRINFGKTDAYEEKLMNEEPAIKPEPIAQGGDRVEIKARIEQALTVIGRSRSALSKELGRDSSFLSAVLTRGRRMPPELLARLEEMAREVAAPRPTETGVTVQEISENPVLALEEPNPAPTEAADLPLLILETGTGPAPDMIEVEIPGLCRVRVPPGVDMGVAAGLIRALLAGIPALNR